MLQAPSVHGGLEISRYFSPRRTGPRRTKKFSDLLDLKCFNILLSIERKVTVTYFVVAVQKVLKFNTLFTYGKVKDCVIIGIIGRTEYNFTPITWVGTGSLV